MECIEKPCRYVLLSGSVIDEDHIARMEYGIEALQGDRSLARYESVCFNGDTMEKLVALCNEGHLDPCQLQDVLEDFTQNDYEL